MDNQQLVQMLQESLPQDLTVRQIEALRSAIQSSAQVRTALLEELHLEEAIATQLAPALASRDQLVQRLNKLDARRQRSRWRWVWMLLLVLGLGAAANVAVQYYVRNLDDRQVAKLDPAHSERSAIVDQGGDAPNDPPAKDNPAPISSPVIDAGGEGGEDGGPDQNVDGAAAKPPHIDEHPKPPAVAPVRDPAWRLFDDAAARGDHSWLSHVDTVVASRNNAPLQIDENQHFIRLNGTYALTPPTEQGQIVRLRLGELNRLKLLFHAGDEIARIEWVGGAKLHGSVGRLPKEHNPELLPDGIDHRFRRERMLKRIDQGIDLNWSGTGPKVNGVDIDADNVAVRWTGQIVAPRDGRYRFTTTSDDGVALHVNGRRLIHNWTDHGSTENHGEIELAAGAHDLVVEYYQATGPAQIRLEWQGPEIERQLVPTDVLRPSADASADRDQRGLQGLYCFGPALDPLPPVDFNYLANDAGRYHYFRRGTIDLRYRDGELIVARGDLVLLALPLEQPPSNVVMDAQCTLRLAELLVLGPLPNQAERIAAAERFAPRHADQSVPAELEWTVQPPPAKQEVELVEHADGSIVLSRQDDSESELWAFTPIEVGAGAEVILELDEASPGTGLVFEGYSGRHTFVIARQPQGDVLCNNPSDSRHVDHMRKTVGTVDRHFFCRIRYGLDHVQVDVGNTGRDWRELWQQRDVSGQAIPQQVRVGIAARHERGPRTIRLRSIRIRRPRAIESLADTALVERAAAVIAALPGIQKSGNPRVVWSAFDDHCPSDVSSRQWRMAGCAVAMKVALKPEIKTAAAMMLLAAAVAEDTAFDAVLAAFAELPLRTIVSSDKSRDCSWSSIHELWAALAAREEAAGNGEHLATLLAAWYQQDWGLGGRGYGPSIIAPIGLVRRCLYQAWAGDDIDALRRVAMRYLYLERHSDGWVHSDNTNKETVALADWMLAVVRRRIPDMPVISSSAQKAGRRADLRHPLVLEMNREAANTVSEFLVAVRDQQFAHACRMLTKHSLPDGIAAVDADGNLSKAILVLLREQIDAHPDLVDMLRRDYESLGQLRLRQFVQHGKYDALESLATQFHGTQAARAALLTLADRDLASGNFFAAAARYGEVVDEAAAADATTILAKRRLALAMTGQLVGEPVSADVQFAGHVMTPNEFERMVKQLAAERRSENVGSTAASDTELAPAPQTMRLVAGNQLSFAPRHGRPYDVAWSMDKRHLAVSTGTHLYLIDRQSKKIQWKKNQKPHQQALKHLGNASLAPLLLSDRLVAVHRPNSDVQLACFDLADGKQQWSQALDDEIVSEPVLIASWIYVITVQKSDSAGYVNVLMHRVSPRTGESVLAMRLLQLRDGDLSLNAGRPWIAGDSLLVRISGTLVCCDLLGNVRWIRRLPLIPYKTDGDLYTLRNPVDKMFVDGDRVVLGSRGSPKIVCVDVARGTVLWSRVATDFRQVVGRMGDQIVITLTGRIVALNRDTGDIAWQRTLAADPQSVLIAKDNTLLTITLTHPDKSGTWKFTPSIRRVDWLAAADGHVIKTVTVDQHADDVHDCQNLITDGRVVFGLSHATRDPKNLRLFWLEP